MPYFTRYADHFRDWQDLVTALEQNEGVLPHLILSRQKLESLLVEAREMATLQATHAARKQEASSRLTTLLNQGSKLATFLRAGIKEHFGNRSEKLTEYRIQPFRGRYLVEAPAAGVPGEREAHRARVAPPPHDRQDPRGARFGAPPFFALNPPSELFAGRIERHVGSSERHARWLERRIGRLERHVESLQRHVGRLETLFHPFNETPNAFNAPLEGFNVTLNGPNAPWIASA